MASRRKEYQEDAKLRALQLITENPQLTSRDLAQKIGISNGSAYYLMASLIAKSFIKIANFKENPKKKKYSYLLTSKGVREKSLIASKFLMRKKIEYEALKEEINALEKSVGIIINDKV